MVGAKQETAGMTRDYLSGVYHNVTDAKKGFGTGLVHHLNQKRAMLIAGEQEMVGKVAEEDKEEEEEKEADQKEPMAMEETRDGRTFTFVSQDRLLDQFALLGFKTCTVPMYRYMHWYTVPNF